VAHLSDRREADLIRRPHRFVDSWVRADAATAANVAAITLAVGTVLIHPLAAGHAAQIVPRLCA